ncbi:mechanosensitive ion channel [Modestobacter sp. I12A-02628]|uniref:Mechanosensitive ion channel family protein n=1 Tax=Goekera deserti TaxID=2497753 RepID=A0A7K3WA31_9ACTN|nr:mechanosensitive ion channel family protein [Goekera deserti]MPQ98898.1 mechanosensitive ion channel [Goekera deserti]NDI49603.1 mechanosensitive ion channel [Goekera deserti]NEL53204.1 mechanosensitive ion channel family protein [Goekera deserti]
MDTRAIGLPSDVQDWITGRGLEVVLIVIGSVLLARFATWVGDRITTRIDQASTGGDALVRSEAAKHRHSVTQVLRWVAIVLIYTLAVILVLDRLGVPVTGLTLPATVLGVGLGFGAQRIVQDLLAGFFIITERQYGFGDVVSITATGAATEATGTVEDVTLRITRLRSSNGEVITVPNGQIVKVVNLSRDWARAVVDVPVQATTDVNRVNEILHAVGTQAFADPDLKPLLLDEPSVMGVESLGLDQVNLRMVARTLPGKQFEVGRDLRARVVKEFRRAGLIVDSSLSTDGDGDHRQGSTPASAGAPASTAPSTTMIPRTPPPAKKTTRERT